MAVNRGKQFEAQVQKALEKYPEEISVDRITDPMAGYAGICNISDFVVYRKPYQYYLECKSIRGNTLSIFSNNTKNKYGTITNNQWEGLLNKSKIQGVFAGVIVWFIEHDTTVYVPIQELERIRNSGAKSLNVRHLDDVKHYILPAQKKRVLFDYDVKSLLWYLGERYGQEQQ